MTDVYLQLRYDEYKHFEDQMRRFAELETTHTTANDGFYHKAFRIRIGDLLLEVQGPFVKKPLDAEEPLNGGRLNARLEGAPPVCPDCGFTQGHALNCPNWRHPHD